MPGLPFAHCCSLSTVKTFLRFASQIFFCYREEDIHFLTIELHLYNQHYDLVFLKVTVLARASPGTLGPHFWAPKIRKYVVDLLLLLKSVWSCSLLSCRVLFCSVVFLCSRTVFPTSSADDYVEMLYWVVSSIKRWSWSYGLVHIYRYVWPEFDNVCNWKMRWLLFKKSCCFCWNNSCWSVCFCR